MRARHLILTHFSQRYPRIPVLTLAAAAGGDGGGDKDCDGGFDDWQAAADDAWGAEGGEWHDEDGGGDGDGGWRSEEAAASGAGDPAKTKAQAEPKPTPQPDTAKLERVGVAFDGLVVRLAEPSLDSLAAAVPLYTRLFQHDEFSTSSPNMTQAAATGGVG
jgi:hypothetical protein